MSIIFNKKNIILVSLLIASLALLFITVNYFNDETKPEKFLRGLLGKKEEDSNQIIVKYKVENLPIVPILLFNSYLLPFISSMTLNKTEINIVNNYKFEKIGAHEIIINLSNELNRLDELFKDVLYLKEVDFTYTKFSIIQSLNSLFMNCKDLESIKFGNLYTTYVYDMNRVFAQCTSLISVDLSNFKVENVISMDYLFYSCHKLKS